MKQNSESNNKQQNNAVNNNSNDAVNNKSKQNQMQDKINLDYDWNTEYGDGDIPDADKL